MECQNSRLVSRLKEFLNSIGVQDPNVKPDKALQILSKKFDELKFKQSPIQTRNNNTQTKLKIFLTYTIYVVTRFPIAYVTGICEEILCKALTYSKGLWEVEVDRHCFHGLGSWLEEALSDNCKCPNPYVRLGLICMVKKFSVTKEQLCLIFIQTICEIKPHHFYPSGDQDNILFDARDLFESISQFQAGNELQQKISADIKEQLKCKQEVDCKNNGATFISHCIQLIGVYAVLATSNPDPDKKDSEIMFACTVFYRGIGSLVNCGKLLPQMSPWQQFQYVITLPPFRHHVVETIQALTAAIDTYDDKLQQGYSRTAKSQLMGLRDVITEGLGVCHKKFQLPWLLLSRQIQGPRLLHQQALLLMDLDPALMMINSGKWNNNTDDWVNDEEALHDYIDVDSESDDLSNGSEDSDIGSNDLDNEIEDSDSDDMSNSSNSWIDDSNA